MMYVPRPEQTTWRHVMETRSGLSDRTICVCTMPDRVFDPVYWEQLLTGTYDPTSHQARSVEPYVRRDMCFTVMSCETASGSLEVGGHHQARVVSCSCLLNASGNGVLTAALECWGLT
jgi:hypothetical protein